MPPKPCALCLKDKPLLYSHIIPEFMLKPVQDWIPTGTHGVAQPHVHQSDVYTLEQGPILKKGDWLKLWGIKEYLLCAGCEEILNKGETYVRETLYGTGRDMVHTSPRCSHSVYRQNGKSEGWEKRWVDYKSFKKFQVGIFWRCCVATGEAFANVQVDPAFEEAMRQAIWNDDLPERLAACRMRKMPGDPKFWLGILGPPPDIQNGVANLLMGGYRWQYDTEEAPEHPIFLTKDGLLTVATSSLLARE